MVELTERMGHILRALFSKSDGFAMGDDSLYKTITERLITDNDPKLKPDCNIAWHSLIGELKEPRKADMVLLTDELMAKIDEENARHFDGLEDFINSTEMWLPNYSEVITSLFHEEVGMKTHSNPMQRHISTTVMGKLRWVLTDFGLNYCMADPLPLLSNSIIPVISKALKNVSHAVEEASTCCYLLI